jgi:ribA/ribD-fused uncharacterized protein
VQTITEFQGSYRFLSNFYPCFIKLEPDQLFYPSVEHAYQAAKTLVTAQRDTIRCADKPGYAKRLGRMITLRKDWEQIKLDVMYELLSQKFNYPDLGAKLLATGDTDLVEGNHWGDHFWGVCRGKGENHLGRLLMQVRHDLKQRKGQE